MPTIQIPNNWKPRTYQRPAWDYLERGGKHAELIWHRRSGKDEIALHRTAVAAFERKASYWHMLPLATQVRKAIWTAINPHTGIRRIDEAFPPEIRKRVNDQEMFIEFINGSTWQALGSDNFNAMVGSPPAGIVYSEWALANPAARAYLRPILAENNGWQMFITTPRGKNHAYQTYEAAKKTPGAFAQLLTIHDTKSMSAERIAEELRSYIADFGEDQGIALFEQEYLCSFEAAILGAYYGKEISNCRKEGRITSVKYDPLFPVHTAWDLGYSDDTAIWWYQVIAGEIRVLAHHSSNGHDLDYYVELITSKGYKYGTHWLPHDARAKTLASGGKSIQEQLVKEFGVSHVRIVPSLSIQDGIQAVRKMFPRVWFNELECEDGINALSQYQRDYDEEKRVFRDKPRHDWTSHTADAFRMMAIAWREEYIHEEKQEPMRGPMQMTMNEAWKTVKPKAQRI